LSATLGASRAKSLSSIDGQRGEQSESRASMAKWLGSIDDQRDEQGKPRASIAK
jgi:hypothetical protein